MTYLFLITFLQVALAKPQNTDLWPAELPGTAVVLPQRTSVMRLFGDSSYTVSRSASVHTSIWDLKDKVAVQYRQQLLKNRKMALALQPGAAVYWDGTPNVNLVLLYTVIRPKSRFTVTAGGELNSSALDLLLGKAFAFPLSVKMDFLNKSSAHRVFYNAQIEDMLVAKKTFTLGYSYAKTIAKRWRFSLGASVLVYDTTSIIDSALLMSEFADYHPALVFLSWLQEADNIPNPLVIPYPTADIWYRF